MSDPSRRLDTSKPFTALQARNAGLSARTLRGPRFRKLGKGVYVAASAEPTKMQAIEAALLTHPSTAYASHGSAAEVYRLPVPHDPLVHITVPDPDDRRRRPGVRAHVWSGAIETTSVHSIRVPYPEQVFVELAAILPLVDLVVAGDALVRRWGSAEHLVAYCRSSKHDHAGRALEAARYVRDEVDSPMETRVRMLLVLAGFPEPVVNFKVRDEHGHVVMRFDLSFPTVRVVIEYDGRQHADSHAQYDRDIERREEIDGMKWRVVVITAPGVFQDPERTLHRVRSILRERGLPGLPTRFDDRWRTHFSVRAAAGR